MRKTTALSIFSILGCILLWDTSSFRLLAQDNNTTLEPLTVSSDGHFLETTKGESFFWLGDTAWELFNKLTKEEILEYLDNRKAKGFNVIQAVIFANTDKPMVPNRYGQVPFFSSDPDRPNERYFELVDWTIKEAAKRRIYMGLLPTWGDKVLKNWSTAEEIFNQQNAYRYGCYLAKRYADYSNIIWILGGDRPPLTDSVDKRPIWEKMLLGLREYPSIAKLATYHPWGESSSSDFWGNDGPWDLNMMQSGHAREDLEVWEWTERDFNKKPYRPILDGEPSYEDHPINWQASKGYFRDWEVRKQLYRSVFSGACGVTYGHHSIWQFYSPDQAPIAGADRFWKEAMDRPGAFQAGYLKKLILSKDAGNRIADPSIILEKEFKEGEHPVAFRDTLSTYLMVYLPIGGQINLRTNQIKKNNLRVTWFSPGTGKRTKIEQIVNKGCQRFQAPGSGQGKDWVLLLE